MPLFPPPGSGSAVVEPNAIGADLISVHAPVGGYVPAHNFNAAIGTGVVSVANRWAIPYRPGGSYTADQIGIEVSTAGAAGALARLAIYASDVEGRRPDALIVDAGTVAADSTGYKMLTINVPFVGGRVYWVAWDAEVASYTTRSYTAPRRYPDSQARVFDGFTSSPYMFVLNGTGAYPSNWTDNGGAQVTLPVIGFRRSA